MTNEQKLLNLLSQMNVPEKRKDLGNVRNIQWLLNHLRYNNRNHPKIEEALNLVKRLKREHNTAPKDLFP